MQENRVQYVLTDKFGDSAPFHNLDLACKRVKAWERQRRQDIRLTDLVEMTDINWKRRGPRLRKN